MLREGRGRLVSGVPSARQRISGSESPLVAVDPRGNALVVWSSDGVVWSASRTATGRWKAPARISATGHDAAAARAALDGQGNAVAVWSDNGVWSALRRRGRAWKDPVRVSTVRAYTSFGNGPQVAIDPRGNAVVVWRSTRNIVQSATRRAGGAWRATLPLSGSGVFVSPHVAIDGQGNAVAVWSVSAMSGGVVMSAVRPAGKGWQVPVPLYRHQTTHPSRAQPEHGCCSQHARRCRGRVEPLARHQLHRGRLGAASSGGVAAGCRDLCGRARNRGIPRRPGAAGGC